VTPEPLEEALVLLLLDAWLPPALSFLEAPPQATMQITAVESRIMNARRIVGSS
jgi:hypothetical protein